MNLLGHAVRWARRRVRNYPDYTKWHYTEDDNFTICGFPIILAVETFFPEIEELEKVNCKKCLKALKGKK